MYRSDDRLQSSFLDFNQPMGLHMNPENRWIRMADMIPWDAFEKKYKNLFKSKTGNVAKPLRMALGALIIQTRFQYSDRELVEQITENPYLQYFIGLPGYQETPPFDASTLVLFRKRINARMLMEANEYLLQENRPDKKDDDDSHHNPPSGNGSGDPDQSADPENKGTLTIDATCAPVYIRYPQDVSLLNEAREKLEEMIAWFHKAYGVALPRRDCRAARKHYLAFAKARKHSAKQIRKALKKQLSYVKRNIGYLEGFMSDGYAPRQKDIAAMLTIFKLYEQQKYMYDNRIHKVENRIVSISQPWIRPIVRGKVKAPVEFGAKLDLSIDAQGYARIEKMSFDAYNESSCLQDAVNAYYERTGYYPERVLADQIYRTRDNRAFCQEHGIRLSGPKLGRPCKTTRKSDKKTEYQDNTDRIEVERRFSLTKRCYGMGRIMTRLEDTQLASIALSVFVANIVRMQQRILSTLFYLLDVLKFQEDWLPACAG